MVNEPLILEMQVQEPLGLVSGDGQTHNYEVSQIPKLSSKKDHELKLEQKLLHLRVSDELGEQKVVPGLSDSSEQPRKLVWKFNEGSVLQQNLRLTKQVVDCPKLDEETLESKPEHADHFNTKLSEPDLSAPPEPQPMQIDDSIEPEHMLTGSAKETNKRIEAEYGSAMD